MLNFEQVVAQYYRDIRHCPEVGSGHGQTVKSSPAPGRHTRNPKAEDRRSGAGRRRLTRNS